MFAIIKTGGKQYRVQEGDILSVERLPAGTGKTTLFDRVLLISDDKQTLIGTPFIERAAVRAAVIQDFKGEKIIVFKKKRRKQYRRTRGHRQELTRVKILNIAADAALLPPEEKVEPERPKPAEAPVKAPMIEVEAAPKPARKEAKPKEKPHAAAKPEKEKKAAKPKKEAPARPSPKKKAK